jgi:hypothetical protein
VTVRGSPWWTLSAKICGRTLSPVNPLRWQKALTEPASRPTVQENVIAVYASVSSSRAHRDPGGRAERGGGEHDDGGVAEPVRAEERPQRHVAGHASDQHGDRDHQERGDAVAAGQQQPDEESGREQPERLQEQERHEEGAGVHDCRECT